MWDGARSTTRAGWAEVNLGRDAPDVHFQVLEGEALLARASVWFTSALEGAGCIGHYAAVHAEAGAAVLEAAGARLRAAGCTRIIGPLDGNTWRAYRLVSDAGSEAPFMLEPQNPPEWNAHFLDAGFTVLATYHSSLAVNPAPDERMGRVRARLEGLGVTTRAANAKDLDGDLEQIYSVALESFAHNFLYTPLSKDAFLGLYRPGLQMLPPEFTRIAEHRGRAVGFAFAVPDLLRSPVDTLILKTVGVRPGRQYAGLGALLGDELHSLARAMNLPRVVHALIYDGNVSGNASARTATVIRRYALYSKDL